MVQRQSFRFAWLGVALAMFASLLLMVGTTSADAQEATVSVTLPDLLLQDSEGTVDVPVALSPGADPVGAISLDLVFDDAIVTAVLNGNQPDCTIGAGGAGSCGPNNPTDTVASALFNFAPGWTEEAVVVTIPLEGLGVEDSTCLAIYVNTVSDTTGAALSYATDASCESGSCPDRPREEGAPQPAASCSQLQIATPTATPTPTPTQTPTPTATPTLTPTPTPSPTPTLTPTPTPTATATPIPTATPEADPTATPEADPTATPEADPTATPEADPTATPEADPTATPEADPTATPEVEATATPTSSPDDPSISGIITEFSSGSAVFGIEVCAFRPFPEGEWCTFSAFDGRYRIEDLPTGNFQVRAEDRAGRFVAGCYGDNPCEDARLFGVRGPVTDIDIALTTPFEDRFGEPTPVPTGAITGQVLRAGAPAVGVDVCAEASLQGVRQCAVTDGLGRYVIEGVPTGNYRVSFDGEAVCYRSQTGCGSWTPVGVVAPFARESINATL